MTIEEVEAQLEELEDATDESVQLATQCLCEQYKDTLIALAKT